MTDQRNDPPPSDMQALALDMITIWQSELSALAGDQELQEYWLQWLALWAQSAERVARWLPSGTHDGASGEAGSAAPPRSEAPLAASDARDAAIEHLEQRIAELERRLAAGPSLGGDAAAAA